ncbi:hypothetical protein HYC85_014849 [Camellia sinensis]|uniref:Rab3GAP catalytic subunit conserved domain-containing protein n=1 Tax=Camellia sinensis TaxID=4442 RepID=A0A7J7H7F2_CAMSI|nr:hypothetical protein HYC85_014849 [Camellia sinensis]
MEGSSIVSKARTAFHSAAAKAERVFTDITKSDSSTDRGNVYIDSIGEVSDNKSPKTPNSDSPNSACESKSHHEVEYCTRKQVPLKTKQDWHERLKNIRIRKKGVEDFDKAGNPTMSFAIFDENLYLMSMTNVSESKGSETGSLPECLSNSSIIPPASVMKLLAIAVEAGKKFNSVKDLLASSRGSSPVRERAISAVKSLVLREKEENFSTEFGGDEKLLSLINLLLDAEGQFPGRKIGTDSDMPTNMTSLPKDIHGAPPESFVVRLSEVIGTFKTLRKMAFFWYKVVSEVINCCISRKRRRDIATESLESVIRQASSNVEESAVSEGTVPVTPVLYARISTGELVLRLGTDKQSDNLTMLENGEPVYTPDMQEGPLLTEDLIKETEELVLRTGSLGAGCSQLLSDMQAFKAANPGCILEDFVRWHSPPDWTEMEPSGDAEVTSNDGDLLSTKGQLSSRMQKEGNLWRELWETAKPVPAVKQAPLFDEDLAVEGILNDLEDIPPSELFEQLFVSLLGCGFVIAEEKLSTNNNLSKLFCECKDYIITTCQGSVWTEKIDDICQVYETVEMMILKPEEAVKMIKQPEETTTTAGEPRRRFKRLSVIFGSKDRHSGKPALKDQNQSFSSIFSKKPPRPDAPSSAEKPVCSVENDWTVV